MRVAVISASYGGYEPIPPRLGTQDRPPNEMIFVHDGAHKGFHRGWGDWRMHYEPRPHLHPNVAAKYPKIHPWDYTSADITIWVDANIDCAPHFVETCLASVDAAFPIAQFIHPLRNCIYDEREASRLPKYDGLPLDMQMEYYKRVFMFPRHWGLWATGVIVRQRSSAVHRFEQRWMQEIMRWGFQDQLSEPLALYMNLMQVSPIGGVDTNLWNTDLIRFRAHGSMT